MPAFRWHYWLIALACLALAPPGVCAPQYDEYQIKGAYLMQIGRFVTYPKDRDSKFVIGIVGENPFNGALRAAAEGYTVNNKPVVIEIYDTPQDIRDCEILFFADATMTGDVLRAVKDRPTLVIGDSEGLAEKRAGPTMNFVVRGTKIRLQVNKSRAEKNGLRLAPKFLRLSTIVELVP